MAETKNINTFIFNHSGVYRDEGLTAHKAPWTLSYVVDFTKLEGTCCYCDELSAKEIRKKLQTLELDSEGPSICWLDSGDYHYMSLFRTENISMPFQLLLIDHHPDMQDPAFGSEVLSCGGWLRTLLRINPNLFRVSILGMDSSLLKETHGYDGIVSTSLNLSKSLPVFISIDKDAMTQDYARTNWDQGDMTFDQLKEILTMVTKEYRILGVDICGERPSSKGGDGSDMLLNRKTNEDLQKLLEELL